MNVEQKPGADVTAQLVSRIAAKDKKPGDFEPLPMPTISKKVMRLTMTRANGTVEESTIIMRAGDSLALDGKTIMSVQLTVSGG